MTTSKNPLAEVFGFPAGNTSGAADRYRRSRLCPFNNKVPNCTKDKASDPLGVCSIVHDKDIVITCPVRFRQDWIIAEQAANFFFNADAQWTSLTEVRLTDVRGKTAGNIDLVLVQYDADGQVTDFGALEIQAVYISGNVRRPFERFMRDPERNANMEWTGRNYPRPDYLSSSRKRLAPQLLYKGGIINSWSRKIAVALNGGLFRTLPKLETVPQSDADIAWLVYELDFNSERNIYEIRLDRTIYSKFNVSLNQITRPEKADENKFIAGLQSKLDEKLEEANPPDAPTLEELLT